MATQNQFEYFKYIYEKERSRHAELINRGKIYLGGLTFYLGFLYAQVETVGKAALEAKVCYIIGVGAVVGALVFSLMALGIYRYSLVSNLTWIIEGFGDRPPTDDDFFDHRIVELAEARRFDAKNNDQRARSLRWASGLSVGSAILDLVSLALAGF